MVYKNTRITVSVSDMKKLESLLFDQNGYEYSGVFEIKKTPERYIASLDEESIRKGNPNRFQANNIVSPKPKTRQISFHTHPNMAYAKLAAVLAPPSIPDYKYAFYRILCGEAAHMVVTLEGPYLIRLQEDALKFFRGILHLFGSIELGAQTLMNYLDAVDKIMGNHNARRFVVNKFAEKVRSITGINKNTKYKSLNGKEYNSANFLLKDASLNDLKSLKKHAKSVYKDTSSAVKNILIGDVIQKFEHTLPVNERNILHSYVRSYPKDILKKGIFHIRLYHRTGRGDNSSAALISDFTQQISFTLALDTSSIPKEVKRNKKNTISEGFTMLSRTPASFLMNNTSPYSSSRNNRKNMNINVNTSSKGRVRNSTNRNNGGSMPMNTSN
jgi:hypothetical protein